MNQNKIGKLVTVKNIGVGNETGKLNFTNFSNNAINYVQNNPREKCLSIPVQTLNNLLSAKSPNLMKIDVEGYELPVLKGANKLLINQKMCRARRFCEKD